MITNKYLKSTAIGTTDRVAASVSQIKIVPIRVKSTILIGLSDVNTFGTDGKAHNNICWIFTDSTFCAIRSLW